MKRIFLSVFAVAMLLFVGSQAQAFDGYRGGGHGHGHGNHGRHGGHGGHHNHGHHSHGHHNHGHHHHNHYPSYNYNRGIYGGYNYYQPRAYYPYQSGFGIRTPGFGLYIGR